MLAMMRLFIHKNMKQFWLYWWISGNAKTSCGKFNCLYFSGINFHLLSVLESTNATTSSENSNVSLGIPSILAATWNSKWNLYSDFSHRSSFYFISMILFSIRYIVGFFKIMNSLAKDKFQKLNCFSSEIASCSQFTQALLDFP